MDRRFGRGRVGRAILAGSAAVLIGCVGPVGAQTDSSFNGYAELLQTPPSPIQYQRDSLRAQQLLDAQRWSEAETLLQKLVRDYPLDTAVGLHQSNWGRLGTALRQQGKQREAVAVYEHILALQGPGLPYASATNARYWIAAGEAALGNREAALDSLDLMVGQDKFVQRPDLAGDPNFARLKDLPRFKAITGTQDTSRLSRNAGWRADVDHLVRDLERVNPDHSPIPRAFYTRAAKLKTAIPKLSDPEIVVGISNMLATLQRGHTTLLPQVPGLRAGLELRPMPVRLHVFPEGLFITEGWAGEEGLAGAQILRLGGLSPDEALSRLAGSTSRESPIETLWQASTLLNRPAFLKGLGGDAQADEAALVLKMPDGKTVTRTVGVSDEMPFDQWRRKLNPPPHVAPQLYLSRRKDEFWLQPMPDRKALYIQVNNFTDSQKELLADFGLRVRQEIERGAPANLILDLRLCNGGNTFRYAELLRTLIAFSTRPGSKVYILIGRSNYSAASNFLADAERLVRPVFVGEPTSQSGNQWGDESGFRLPYSGLYGIVSGAKWQLSHPWDRRRSIVPDVPVQMTAAAYFSGEDPILETVFQMIEEQPKPTAATFAPQRGTSAR